MMTFVSKAQSQSLIILGWYLPFNVCTYITFLLILSAEFGDYDSPDISANYLKDFKVCPDQVSRQIRHCLPGTHGMRNAYSRPFDIFFFNFLSTVLKP